MKVLVFGSGGQVARALIASAPSRFEIDALGRNECDISDKESVCRAIEASNADIIINGAAYTAVDAAERDFATAQLVNGDAPGWMATAATGRRFVHISTDFVFDGSANVPYLPASPANPINVYGTTKLNGEKAALAASDDVLIARTSWIYSSVGRNFPLTMLRLMGGQSSIRVVTDQIGCPTWATSFARSLWHLVGAECTGVYHLTDSGLCSWYDFAIAIAEEAKALGLLSDTPAVLPIRSTEYPTPARRPTYSVLDNRAAYDLVGAAPLHWRESLRMMLKEIGDE